jgi:hypothetical protein
MEKCNGVFVLIVEASNKLVKVVEEDKPVSENTRLQPVVWTNTKIYDHLGQGRKK